MAAAGIAASRLFACLTAIGQDASPDKLLQEQAASGDANAQYSLGLMYWEHKPFGRENFEKAKSWFRKAAEQGHVKAQVMLGELTIFSGGDHAEAMSWYRKAADQGDVDGQAGVGWIYSLDHNDTEAMLWFHKAADRGNALAQWMLG